MASPGRKSDDICGVWIDKDEIAAEEIKKYIQNISKKPVVKADLEDLTFLQDDTKYSKYFVLISRHSSKDHQFMVFITTVLYHLYYLKLVSKVVLVIVDRRFKEDKHLPINLLSFERVSVLPSKVSKEGKQTKADFKEEDLHNIYLKLTEQPHKIEDVLPIGNVGIGLAWSYFYGYLNLILPEMEERIKKSQHYERNKDKMCTKFLIIIPESCKTPNRFSEVDKRFITEGPLDEGIKKHRAGQPARLYKTFVHNIKGKDQQEDRYFCGEFATPVLSLRKMLEEKIIDEREMDKQMVLFRHSLMAIINYKRNPNCVSKAVVVSYADRSNPLSLADELYGQIRLESKDSPMEAKGLPKERLSTGGIDSDPSTAGTTGTSSLSSIVSVDVVDIISGPDGKKWEDSIGQFLGVDEKATDIDSELPQIHLIRKHHSFENLHPKLLNPTIVDQNTTTASDKLLIILSEKFKGEVEKCHKELIAHPIWFPRTTYIVDLENIPDWLEKSGADYIDARKNDVWRRIFGSLYGTSSVEGAVDKRWVEYSEGTQYQCDRLPIGLVAEGLAHSFYHNYLALLGPKLAERIQKTDYFLQGMMPTKYFILLPYSCFSFPKLEEADPVITSVGNLETLTVQVAGNNRNYDNAVHKITTNGQTYYACVEYCTPVLVMYEMEAEGKAGLTPMQKEAQLHIFRRVLQEILNTSDYGQFFKLICYEDRGLEKRELSEILVENIEECLSV